MARFPIALIFPVLSTMVVAGCVPATGRPVPLADPSRDAAPARHDESPATRWVVGSEWTFVVGAAGGETDTYVVRVTDRPMFDSDRWFWLEALVDPRPSWTSYTIAPDGTHTPAESRFGLAAALDGRHLEIELAAGIKDVGARLVGELDGDRFRGQLRRSNFVEGETVGPDVVGWRSR